MAVGAVWFLAKCDVPSEFAKELLGALISASAISAGFLTTALSILLPLGSTETGRRLQNSGHMLSLHRFLRSGILSCLFLAVLCIAAFLFLSPESKSIGKYWSTAILISGTHSTASLVRVAEILLNLFERLSVPENQDG
ncbi:hypothetical protein [Hydrogenophaga aquatica]